MADIFNSFSRGFTQGRELRDDRMKRNALMQAGEAFSGGDYKSAANALFPQDMAGALRIQEYGRGLEADKAAQEQKTKLAEQERAKATLTAFGQMAQALKPLPMEARLPEAQRYVQRIAPALGMDAEQLLAMMDPNDFTDTNIDSTIALSMDPDAYAKLQAQGRPQILGEGGMLVDNTGKVLRENPKNFAPQTEAEAYRMLTPDEVKTMGLPPGSYQRSGKGQISAVGSQGKGANLTPGDTIKARSAILAVPKIRSAYDRFIEALRSASDKDIAGVGSGAGTLQSAHRLLAIQMKSEGALDLGALVGADFAILNDIVGEPGNLKQIIAQGGREGYLNRLAEVDRFLTSSGATLRQVYEPYKDTPGLEDLYREEGAPTAKPGAPKRIKLVPEQ